MNTTDPPPDPFYDTEVAPVLMELAKRCHERGLSFLACVGFAPNQHGITCTMDDADLSMHMLRMCAETSPNIDGYIIRLARFCADRGIDTKNSIVLNRFWT